MAWAIPGEIDREQDRSLLFHQPLPRATTLSSYGAPVIVLQIIITIIILKMWSGGGGGEWGV